MNFYDFVKRIMGIPPRSDYGNENYYGHRFRSPMWDRDDNDDDDDDGDPEDELRNVPSSPFGFHIFSGDPMDMHRYFEQQFDEMLKSFRAMEGTVFGSGLVKLPDLLPGEDENIHSEESIRDRYLKPSFERSLPPGAPKSDSDLDDKIKAGDLGILLPDNDPSIGHHIPQRAFGQSVVTKTFMLPDGRVEHHKTVKNHDGNEEVTVMRKIGDQSYSVTTIRDKNGTSEEKEEFINLNQDELKDFEYKWGGRNKYQPNPNSPSSLLQIIDNIFRY